MVAALVSPSSEGTLRPARWTSETVQEAARPDKCSSQQSYHKRKPDDEFANIHLSYFTADDKEIVVYCPESRHAVATQNPMRKELDEKTQDLT